MVGDDDLVRTAASDLLHLVFGSDTVVLFHSKPVVYVDSGSGLDAANLVGSALEVALLDLDAPDGIP